LVIGFVDHEHGEILEHVDLGFLMFFTGELLIRLWRARLGFFRSPWNCADAIIIGLALLPVLGGGVDVLRIARLARGAHLLKHVTVLRLWRLVRFPATGKHWLTAALIAAGVVVAPAAHASVMPSAPPPPMSPCNLSVTRDLILWQRWPRVQDFATEIGDVDYPQCKPALDVWRDSEQTGPGYCAKIAWASDNPGYDVEARPAPQPKHVIDVVGDC
jgi:Ion transport protein